MKRLALITWLPLAAIAALTLWWSSGQRPAISQTHIDSPPPETVLTITPENTQITGFTQRYAGEDVYGTAATLAQLTFPSTSHLSRPNAVILANPDLNEALMTVQQLIHMPIDAPILYTQPDALHPTTRAAMQMLHPEGIAYDNNVKALIVGEMSPAVLNEVKAMGFAYRRISPDSNDPVDLAVAIDDYRASMMGNHPDTVIIASLDEPEFALPATAFLAHAMSNIAFVERDSIPQGTRDMLTHRYGPSYMYVMGPESAVSEAVVEELSTYGHVQRLATADPYSMSAYFAGYADFGNNFGYWIWQIPRHMGWGVAEPGHNFTFANPDNWAETIAGTILSHRGKHGPMLLVEENNIPDSVRSYLNSTVRPRPSAPRDQLFNHGSIVGGNDVISREIQGELDGLLQPKSISAVQQGE